jgi:Flp pilus assembly protein TadG
MRTATSSAGRFFASIRTIGGRALPFIHSGRGQSMLEAALIIPLLCMVMLNAVNFGYMFYIYLNMAAAPRQGAEYSIQGTHTIQESVPTSSNVSSLVYASLTDVPSSSTTPMRVCSVSNGLTNSGTSSQTPACVTYGSSATFPTDTNCPKSTICPDPESPTFVLNRVDVQYTVTPLVPGTAFHLIFPSSMTFHRFIYMRVQ